MNQIALFLLSTLSIVSVPALTVVIGELSRMHVADPSKAAYRATGQISDFCTGTLVASNLVLTAGHCAYDLEKDEFLKNLTFTPARNGTLAPFGTAKVKEAFVHPDFFVRKDIAADLALLELDQHIGLKTGWSGMDFTLRGSGRGTIQGYPGDKADGTLWLVACLFEFPLSFTQNPMAHYTCDTFGGMSGGALMRADELGRSVIFGVHTQGQGSHRNAGVTLTGQNAEFILDVLKQKIPEMFGERP